jgi:WD40 repeat protein
MIKNDRLLVQGTERVVYVGTKRGKLKQVAWFHGGQQFIDTVSVLDVIMTSTESHETRHDTTGEDVAIHREDFIFKPYPIYCMANVLHQRSDFGHDGNEDYDNRRREILLCGGADRFVTVLEKEQIDSHKWTMVQRLGPHTGWVKDMVQYTPKSQSALLLFSIGCNCIEVWKMEEKCQEIMFRHWKKLAIESSVTMGCTLSSDILCLGIYEDMYLLAAGVDGRVHKWEICDESLHKSDAMATHDGRVNAIIVCELLNVIITSGNDGKVVCLELSQSQSQLWRTCDLDLCETLGCGVKVTCLGIIKEDCSEAIVAVGTASGLVLLARVCYANDDDDKYNISLLGVDCVLDVGADCTVYALQRLESMPCLEGTKYCVAVGHQNGMQIWEFVLK